MHGRTPQLHGFLRHPTPGVRRQGEREGVVPRAIGRPCRLGIHLQSGAEYDVASLFEAHDTYVILEVHGSGEEPKRSERWQDEHPEQTPWIFDQVAIPYREISAAYLTPKGAGSETDTSIGFRLEAREPGS